MQWLPWKPAKMTQFNAHHPRKTSVSRRLIRQVVVLSAIGMVGLSGTIFFCLRWSLERVQKRLDETSLAAARNFDLFFLQIESDLLATSSFLSETDDFDEMLRLMKYRNVSFRELLLVDFEGNILAREDSSADRATLTKLDAQPWLENGPKVGEVYIGAVNLDQQTPTVTMAITATDDVSLPIATLVAQVDLTELWNATIDRQVGQTGYAYITDESGQIVAYRNRRLQEAGNTLEKLLGLSPQDIADATLHLHRGLSGQWVLSSGHSLSAVPWYAIVEQPAAEALVFFLILAIVLLVFFAIAIALVWSIVRFSRDRIVSPLLSLQDAVTRMSGGELDQRIAVESADELGVLAESFNQMAQQLQDSFATLATANQELERRVAERTAQLQEAKLAADSANQAKSEFLANMSHELRTPLNGILGYAQILQRDPTANPKQKDGVTIIYQCGSHLLNLINDVLDLSKIEARKLELFPKDFDFPVFLKGVVEISRIKAEQKDIAFVYEALNPLPLAVKADEKRLRQVLLNLLGNAIKFTDQGQVRLKVGVTASTENTATVRLQVEDTGVGMTPEQLDKIFQPFEQVGENERKSEGTGLGLAISRQIVEMMGGELHVESTLAVGSTFWFELDFPVVEEWHGDSTVQPVQMLLGYEGARRKILVVDDRWENRAVIRNLLEPLGLAIHEAENGQHGLEMAETWRPDLIITDLVMPEMDGFEMTQALRSRPDLQEIPVIASSASVFNFDREKSREVGCCDFLAKPVQAEELFAQLQTYLKLQWLVAQPAAAMATSTTELIIPPEAELMTLKEALKMGDFRTLGREGERLKQLSPQYLVFAQKLLACVRQFDEDAIAELLKNPSQDTSVGAGTT